jgi:hypothetical protein
VEPTRIRLTHRDDHHRILVTATFADGSDRARSRSAHFVVTDPAIVSVSDGIVRPLKAGATTILIRDGTQSASVAVEVSSVLSRPISFANDVMPTLSHAGCNAGACHGSASGKKGFKVSLRGYDPAADYMTLTRGGSARRLDVLDPSGSLLLLKPTGQVVHEGGKRFDAQSDSARVLTHWIAEGARSDLATASKLVGLEVSPAFRTFAKPGGSQRLLVRATFSDGSVRDVTERARYASSNERAALPRDGLVSLLDKGEAAIMVRYGHLVAVSNLVVLRHDPGFRWNNPPQKGYIDRHVFAKLKAMEVLPSELCEDVVFLGIRLMCARCHDHPFEKWVQKDYYGLTAFFSQVGRKTGRRPGELVVFCQDSPALSRHPVTREALTPKYLDGASVPVNDAQNARRLLAEWLTRKDNPFLARATVNRLWAQLFGRGIIEPVDDIRSSNPPVNAPLLDALTKDFVESGFDVRHILRTVLNSRTYQLSARSNRFNSQDHTCFSHALPRRLTAEELLDTLGQITGVRETYRSRIAGQGTVALPAGGLRAVQLPDRMLTAELLDLFGRPRGESTCSCQRSEEASLTQALHLINGKTITARIADPNGKLTRLVRTPGLTDEKLIEELYLLVLCRFPTGAEQALVHKHLAGTKDRLAAAQDVVWTLLNAREFLFNH